MIRSKFIGGILLIVGTSIGGGMLALPMATASGGFLHSLLLFVAVWLVTVVAAFFILEVNLSLPNNTNLVSMAKRTLGPLGQVVTWVFYLLLLYALLCAYTAGGSDLVQSLLQGVGLSVSSALSSFIFLVILGSIVFNGIRVVDFTNRGLMFAKLSLYFLLVLLISPHVNTPYLKGGSYTMLFSAVFVVVTSFGYAIIIPSLRTYFHSDVKKLRWVLGVGSLVPLICYVLWDAAVQGSLPVGGPEGLEHIASSAHAVSKMTSLLSVTAHNHWVGKMTHLFSYVCIATSFLGVSLCLTDFLADGFQMRKQGGSRWFIMACTFVPPWLIVVLYPHAFITALSYAGLFCVILLLLLPGLMVWYGRYKTKTITGYRFFGGKFVVIIEIFISVLLIIFGIKQLF